MMEAVCSSLRGFCCSQWTTLASTHIARAFTASSALRWVCFPLQTLLVATSNLCRGPLVTCCRDVGAGSDRKDFARGSDHREVNPGHSRPSRFVEAILGARSIPARAKAPTVRLTSLVLHDGRLQGFESIAWSLAVS